MAKSGGHERDPDGFQIVKRKKHRGKSRLVSERRASEQSEVYTGPPADSIITQISAYRHSIRKTQFYHEIISLMKLSEYKEFICYGIGHIGTCRIAQQQFGLLLELCPTPAPCTLFDPVLYPEEKSAVERAGCILQPNNELCKHRVEQPTLFYMPHCGRAMYNNLLWSNWSAPSLSHVTIIGNRLSSYHERISTEKLVKETPYIHRVLPYCTEVPLPNGYPDSTVFNDLAIHTFPADKLQAASLQEWTDCIEPTLDPTDPEIIIS